MSISVCYIHTSICPTNSRKYKQSQHSIYHSQINGKLMLIISGNDVSLLEHVVVLTERRSDPADSPRLLADYSQSNSRGHTLGFPSQPPQLQHMYNSYGFPCFLNYTYAPDLVRLKGDLSNYRWYIVSMSVKHVKDIAMSNKRSSHRHTILGIHVLPIHCHSFTLATINVQGKLSTTSQSPYVNSWGSSAWIQLFPWVWILYSNFNHNTTICEFLHNNIEVTIVYECVCFGCYVSLHCTGTASMIVFQDSQQGRQPHMHAPTPITPEGSLLYLLNLRLIYWVGNTWN